MLITRTTTFSSLRLTPRSKETASTGGERAAALETDLQLAAVVIRIQLEQTPALGVWSQTAPTPCRISKLSVVASTLLLATSSLWKLEFESYLPGRASQVARACVWETLLLSLLSCYCNAHWLTKKKLKKKRRISVDRGASDRWFNSLTFRGQPY